MGLPKTQFLAQKRASSGIYFKKVARPLFLLLAFLPDEFSDWTRRSYTFQINTRPFAFGCSQQKGTIGHRRRGSTLLTTG